LYSGTGTDQNVEVSYTGSSAVINQSAVLTTTWQRFQYTATVGTTATELAVWFAAVPTGTAGAADYFEITGVQLELGSVASTFKRAKGGTLQGELDACMRYCYKFIEGTGKSFGTGANYTASIALVGITLPVPMRTTPTLVATSGTNYYGFYRDGVGDLFDSVSLSDAGPTAIVLNNGSQISGTSGHAGVMITANASASIIFTAEL
jgi:hypothetical protein